MAAPRPIIKKATAAQGTWAEKLKEAKARPYKGNKGGLPEKTSNYGRGNLNRAMTPDKINLGQSGRSSSRAMTTTGSKALTKTGSKALTTAASKLPSVGTIAAGGLGLASKAFLGAGSAVVGMVTEAKPAGSPQERSWERRNTEQRRMKGKASGMGFTGSGKTNPDVPKRQAAGIRKYTSPVGPFKPTSTATGSPFPKGKGTPYAPKTSGASVAGQANTGGAKDKKKTGATSAAPAVSKPKRKSHFQRRQAERYAIGSSGKSL